jgi:hypothetical protein
VNLGLAPQPTPVTGPRADSVPGCFEGLLGAEPHAPAVILVRADGRRRVWTRAAVEHRAVRLGAYIAGRHLGRNDAVAVTTTGALDTMAAVYLLLASGRRLASPGDALHRIGDEDFATADLGSQRYQIACAVVGGDAAMLSGGRFIRHRDLLARASNGRVEPGLQPDLVARALVALATGAPLTVEGDGLRAVFAQARAA